MAEKAPRTVIESRTPHVRLIDWNRPIIARTVPVSKDPALCRPLKIDGRDTVVGIERAKISADVGVGADGRAVCVLVISAHINASPEQFRAASDQCISNATVSGRNGNGTGWKSCRSFVIAIAFEASANSVSYAHGDIFHRSRQLTRCCRSRQSFSNQAELEAC
jgi:hypothetical protein